MSYGMGEALQTAVFQRLSADPAIGALVGDAIYDAVPTGGKPGTYVELGPEDVRDRSDASRGGAEHRFQVSVVTDAAGYGAAKAVAAAISDALDGADLAMSRGRLVGLWFERARAERSGKAGRVRRIDLRFRARVEAE